MLGKAFLGSIFLAATVTLCKQFTATSYNDTCNKIEQITSSESQVFYPGESRYHIIGRTNTSTSFIIDVGSTGSPEFNADISHWANSSSQISACSVEPGTPHDVGLIVMVIIIYPYRLIDITPRRSLSNSPHRRHRLQSRALGTLSIAGSRRPTAYKSHWRALTTLS
jgi:hypothetical protein